jgi:hypothetical protein
MKEKLPFPQISQFCCRIAGAGNCCIPVMETIMCKFQASSFGLVFEEE